LSTSMEGPGGRERRGWVPAHKRQAAVCQATVAHAGGRDEGGSGGGRGEREGTGHNDGLGVELKRGHSGGEPRSECLLTKKPHSGPLKLEQASPTGVRAKGGNTTGKGERRGTVLYGLAVVLVGGTQ
jgi:hypothetical protein